MDTDVIVQKPVDELLCNSIVLQDHNETINNAIFCFDAGHPIPYLAMEIQANQTDHIIGDGPSQLTQAFRKYQQRKRYDYKIIETEKLFPVPFWAYRRFYSLANDTKSVDNATAVHFWKYMLVNFKMPWIVHEESLLYLMMRKHCLPIIPRLGKEGKAMTSKRRKFKDPKDQFGY